METNRKFWAEFIELYREHSCLWNVKSKEYSNKHKRNASYEALLKKLKEIKPEAKLEHLKKKINNMRTSFRRELKKLNDSKPTGTGSDDVYEPTLWYFDLLLFTAQSESGRKGRETDEEGYDVLEDNDTMDLEDDSEDETEPTPPTPSTSVDDLLLNSQEIFSQNSSTPSSSQSSSSVITQINSRKRSVPNKKNNNAFEQKKMHVLELAHNVLSNKSSNDEDEYSIAGKRIGYQLKGIEERQRIIAEKLISDVMYYAKMGRLTEEASVCCNRQLNNSQNYGITTAHHPFQMTQAYPFNNGDYNNTRPPSVRSYFSNYETSDSGK